MTISIAHASDRDGSAVARSLKEQLGVIDPVFVLFFASPEYDPARLGTALRSEFGDVPSLGCTTAGEIISGKMLDGSVVLMAFDRGAVGVATTAHVDLGAGDGAVGEALIRLVRPTGKPIGELSPECYLGLVVHDGLSLAEERTMSAITSRSNVPFIGGSAGDALRFRGTHVFVDFEPRQNASGLALLGTVKPYRILKTQSFDVLEHELEVTAVDEATRTVRSFNGRPAASEYARALGVQVAELAERFGDHPLGLLVDENEPYVRSPQRIEGEAVVFFCQVKEGMPLRLLSARDIVADTRRDLAEALGDLGPAQGIVNFHCILRTLELRQKGLCEDYGRIFAEYPTIGFSTYGESYIGHINQTSTMVLFG
jgi:hypothetical protein